MPQAWEVKLVNSKVVVVGHCSSWSVADNTNRLSMILLLVRQHIKIVIRREAAEFYGTTSMSVGDILW